MKGKRTLFLIVAGIISICVLIGSLKGYDAIWSIWKIPVLSPYFCDLRNLTGGSESISMGYDPLYCNPQDPWERPMNQPRIVQHIVSILKINQGHTAIIGTLFILLFFIGIFISLKRIDNLTALILAVVIFSPSVMLGIERGNHDLFIFFLVSAALFISSYPVISMLILLIASFIKLFPVFALSYFFRYVKKTQFLIFSGFIIAFMVYFLLNSADWPQLINSTEKGYGVLGYGVQTYSKSLDITSYVPLLAIMMVSLIFYVSSIHVHGFKQGDDTHIDAFRAGAGIYMGTFFLGNCWAYRLMFLIFVIPQLVSWRKDIKRGFISLIALICIIISCWSLWGKDIYSGRPAFAIDEISNWILLASLFYLWLSSLPLSIQNSMIKGVSLSDSSAKLK